MSQDDEDKLIASSRLALLGEMMGGIVHEISTPLTIIHMQLAELSQSVGSSATDQKDHQQRCIQQIQTQVDRVYKIVKSTKNLSRASESDPFEKQPLEPLVNDCLEICRDKQKYAGIKVDFSGKAGLVYCRGSQIIQLLLNLLNNAHDAIAALPDQLPDQLQDRSSDNSSDKMGKTGTKWVSIRLEETEDQAILHVCDSGPGIPEELRAKIFDSFFTTKPVGKGTGLGLSISKQIAELHQGSLSYQLKEGHTCFTVRLPKATYFKISEGSR